MVVYICTTFGSYGASLADFSEGEGRIEPFFSRKKLKSVQPL